VDKVGVRLRQAVVVASDFASTEERLRAELGLGEPFHDPGVAAFGLQNAVFALGDAFLEVVSPIQPDTTAGRYLERRGGDCGYMVIFQLDDLESARARVQEMGIRVVWQADLDDISGTHLHPADTRGAIVSLDRADPPETWHWGGPDWIGTAGPGAPGRLAGAAIEVADPRGVATRWSKFLGVRATRSDRLDLDGGFVEFLATYDARGEGLTEIVVEVPQEVRRGRDLVEIAGVRFRMIPSR
jgi:hypothetical protein